MTMQSGRTDGTCASSMDDRANCRDDPSTGDEMTLKPRDDPSTGDEMTLKPFKGG